MDRILTKAMREQIATQFTINTISNKIFAAFLTFTITKCVPMGFKWLSHDLTLKAFFYLFYNIFIYV